MPLSRRTFFRTGISFGSVSLAGCIAEQDGSSSEETPPATPSDETPPATPSEETRTESTTGAEEMPTEITLWFERVTLSGSQRASLDPIVVADLSEAEREIVNTALEDGEYVEQIGEESAALESLRARIEERAGDGGVEAYLGREDTYYRIGLVAGDHIIASP